MISYTESGLFSTDASCRLINQNSEQFSERKKGGIQFSQQSKRTDCLPVISSSVKTELKFVYVMIHVTVGLLKACWLEALRRKENNTSCLLCQIISFLYSFVFNEHFQSLSIISLLWSLYLTIEFKRWHIYIYILL